jgi:hypothetical protein
MASTKYITPVVAEVAEHRKVSDAAASEAVAVIVEVARVVTVDAVV